MSWASHPTTAMPSPPVRSGGRHRGPNRGAMLAVIVGVLLVLIALTAYVVPRELAVGGPASAAPSAQSSDPSSSGAISTTNPSAGPSESAPAPAPVPSTTAADPAPNPVSVADSPTLEATVFSLTNAERSKVGCRALTLNSAIGAAARAHSVEMARTGSFSHTGVNGSSPGDRMRLAGYDTRAGWAENIAYGQRTATAVMSSWMNSSGHRANILNCGLTAIGVGVARAGNGQLYWTQDFGIA